MKRGAIRSKYGRDQVGRRRRWYGSRAHSRCPKALACDRPAPTTGRLANGRDRPPAYADSCAREHARPRAAGEMRGWRREVRLESGHAPPDPAPRRDPRNQGTFRLAREEARIGVWNDPGTKLVTDADLLAQA